MTNFGLNEKNLKTVHAILMAHPSVERAIVYGSRAKGTNRSGSDIDLSLQGAELDYKELGKIAGELDESSIPYLVDLSIYHKLDNPRFRQVIDEEGVEFYRRGA